MPSKFCCQTGSKVGGGQLNLLYPDLLKRCVHESQLLFLQCCVSAMKKTGFENFSLSDSCSPSNLPSSVDCFLIFAPVVVFNTFSASKAVWEQKCLISFTTMSPWEAEHAGALISPFLLPMPDPPHGPPPPPPPPWTTGELRAPRFCCKLTTAAGFKIGAVYTNKWHNPIWPEKINPPRCIKDSHCGTTEVYLD